LKNVNRSQTRGGRLALRWKLSDRWTLDAIGVAQRIDNRDAPYEAADGPALSRSSPFAQPSYNLFLSASAVIMGKIGVLSVHSTTGIVHQSLGERFEVLLPASGTNLFDETEHTNLFSQEVRVSRSSPLADWVLGASFIQSEDHESRAYGRPDKVIPLAALRQRTSEANVYAQATRRLVGSLSVTLGGRYDLDHLSGDTVNHSSPFNVLIDKRLRSTSDERRFAPSVALSYAPLPKLVTFLRYETGFRPGGLTLGTQARSYTGDRLGTAEFGARYGIAGKGPFAFSLTGAATRWRNIQADILDGIGEPAIANIGDGLVTTIDGTLDIRVVSDIEIHASGFLAHSRLRPSGVLLGGDNDTVLPNVARNGGSATLDYSHDDGEGLAWRGGIRVQHVGPSILGVGTLLEGRQGNYTTVALDAEVTVRRVAFTFDVTNLLDSRAPAFDVGTPFAAFLEHDVTPLRPRTARLGMHYSF
jgi:outer membrane receptor protein involved in Fe transport